MIPNLTELMQRVEEARSVAENEMARYCTGSSATCDICEVRDELNMATDLLLARLVSVIRCSGCGGGGMVGSPSHEGCSDECGKRYRACPKCGPDRAAIEKLKP